MTDREMLKRAAAAAGKDHVFWSNAYKDWIRMHDSAPWRPLTDDGDALRLAVWLKLIVSVDETCALVMDAFELGEIHILEDVGTDPYAATRRAVVRAAAEMEKEKQ